MRLEPIQDLAAGDEEILKVDLGRYLKALRRYAWVIAAIVALAVTGAVIYTVRAIRIYEATASVKIEPKLPDLLGQSAEMLAAGAATGDYYKQQLQILKSNRLLRMTIENNQLQLQLVSDKEREGQPDDAVYQLATERLADMVKITYPDQNRIMLVTVRSADAKLAMDIANDHVQTYVAYSKGLITNPLAQDALQKQFDAAEKDLQASEVELYKFQKDNDLLAMSLEDRQTMASANISSFTNRVNDARSRRIEMNARLQQMMKKAAPGGDVLDSPALVLSQSVALDTLKGQYFEERTRFAEVEKELGPKAPEYQAQKAKVDDLHQALEAEVQRQLSALDGEYQAALATESALRNEIVAAQAQAMELVPKIYAYNDLLRKKKTNEDKYNIVVARLSNSIMTGELNRDTNVNFVEPLDFATLPTDPVSPKMRVNVAIAVALSLFLGLGVIGLLTWLDRSVKSVEDAQAAAAVPVLGVIPVLNDADMVGSDDRTRDLYVHQKPKSPVAECCRSVRTNIVFSAADRPMQTLVVSSANPREGKTTTVIYLGTTMAQSGQRVLLVDTDMRRPRLHASTGVSRQKGLSNLIVGDDDYEGVIKSTEIPNLYVLPCGPLPPNPAELLMTKRFAHVLDELKKRFDRIILDSPPLQAVTDAVVLSKQTDGVILVVRSGKTLRDDVKRSVRQIRDVEGLIVGTILNEFSVDDRSYYYYRYGYGYGESSKEGTEASQTA